MPKPEAETIGECSLYRADCLDVLCGLSANSVDLVLGSPPYEAARYYGIDFRLRGQEWVDWSVVRYLECVRVCRGLVAWVVEGQTRQFRWSATPALLMADLHRAGVWLRKPPAFCRVGIPGSGGPDWWRNDYEFIICSSKGKLPWSKNTACGHPPKWGPGGEMSYRVSSGARVNQWGHSIETGATIVRDGGVVRSKGKRPSHRLERGNPDGTCAYRPPVLANPGNLIHCRVGGGLMGDRLCHDNEAPFPEALAERFIWSFCPPGGIVLDPFCGSGTTLAVAIRQGRRAMGIDIRESQVSLTRRRVQRATGEPDLFAAMPEESCPT